MTIETLSLIIVLAPLFGSIAAGLLPLDRTTAHRITISGVSIAFILSVWVFYQVTIQGQAPFADGAYTMTLYQWLATGDLKLEIGFMIDTLTTTMMVTVTFVSWMVHIYTIGYMKEDQHNWSDGSLAGKNSYQRFFSYISLFTFSMLMLVMSNNFLQLFFGWEAVGLVSYLLIGFWFQRETAIYANLKAFLVNRVGDFGFLLGIAAVLMYFGSLDYQTVFNAVTSNPEKYTSMTIELFSGHQWSVITVICILLFIGAMGKSAQVPLHIWLPDSMEGPTPISALIHAATMVTAGIFMVSRMSPLYELSVTALSFILIIGSITALFMGFLGLVQTDIKRVVAYSTLSQLGYMTVALGASAYGAAMFHLMTHAFFKALLFLAAGSVIIAMHHQQDMRKMGGLKKYLPITYWTSLIGSLALIGFPGFSGFFSKDAIIHAVHVAHDNHQVGAEFAYYSVLAGVFITALYSFRMFFLVFHGKERMDDHTREHLHEPSWVVTYPLLALAVPSVVIGAIALGPMLYNNYFGSAIVIAEGRNAFLAADYHGVIDFIKHGFLQPPVYLAFAGVFVAWFLYMVKTDIPAKIQSLFSYIHKIFIEKYFADRFNEWFFAGGARAIGGLLWKFGDRNMIDGFMVNGTAGSVRWLSEKLRYLQSGLLSQYAFAMLLGLLFFLVWFVHG